ncbi:MAG: DegT/DnrJ/EryC1/StrS family aminotransferase [Propionibacteriales bacterium]|nr:DegT/DnrJ/EryC1/StrS family aminotransferase [Propionibacteriales bacterium]
MERQPQTVRVDQDGRRDHRLSRPTSSTNQRRMTLALRVLGIGPGDEVVVPANTFVATVEAIVLVGARPRFADVDPDTLLMTADTMKAAATPATRAAIVVHLYGQMADVDDLARGATELRIALLEDAAQAHGARWHSARAGSLGRVGCFSFYPGKNLGAFGDAGAVVTSDSALAERLRSLRDHGTASGGRYQHEVLGTNSRLDSLQAVVLTVKLRRLDGWNARRRRLVDHYRRLLDPELVQLVDQRPESQPVHHLAVARVRNRDQVREILVNKGIGTRIHYPTPCHQLPPYTRFSHVPLPVTESAAREILSLPLHPHMAERDVERVSATLTAAVLEARSS